jgi:tetratricopeptide (TPR) repeat protein
MHSVARPNFSAVGGPHPNFGGSGALPNLGGSTRPNLGSGASRPNFGSIANHTPSFSHPIGGGSSRPNLDIAQHPEFGGGFRPGAGGSSARNPLFAGGSTRPSLDIAHRPEFGGGSRPGAGGSGIRNPNLGGIGYQPNIGGGIGNRTNIGGEIGSNTNIGNRTNIGQFGNTNFNNFQNNTNFASNRPYYNNWQHGNWNGHWNRPDGGGYWNGWAHGYANGYNPDYWNGGWGGHWHGAMGGNWGGQWYDAPISWGLGAWALGSTMYSSGYAGYSNPYYSGDTSTAADYDYSQPITVINQQLDPSLTAAPDQTFVAGSDAPPTPEVEEGTTHTDLARAAFMEGDYDRAMRELDVAIKALPNDAALHEFRALVFFAMRDYQQAAAVLYAVLSAGPGWDWTTLSGMYASIATYTAQLRELEQFVRLNPDAADARFVLAYQYLAGGHPESARKQYEQVAKLQPDDQLAAQLLRLVGGDPTAPSGIAPTPDSPDAQSTGPIPPADIDAAKIVGKWTAKRSDGTRFLLSLTQDSSFSWRHEQGGKSQEFGGKYSVDGAILVLKRTDGAQMPGLVSMADGGFNFKLYGGSPDDPGLDFKKS